jgi:hypothetical protein
MHPLHRVTGFEHLGPYRLAVQFADGTSQDIDFSQVLGGELLGPLRNLAIFEGVKLDPEAGTLAWPNGVDFDPATLHDWPQHQPALIELVRSWESVRI